MGRREKLGLGLFRWLSIILKNYSEKSCKKMLKTRQEARGGIQSMRVEAEWVGNLKEGYFRNMVVALLQWMQKLKLINSPVMVKIPTNSPMFLPASITSSSE